MQRSTTTAIVQIIRQMIPGTGMTLVTEAGRLQLLSRRQVWVQRVEVRVKLARQEEQTTCWQVSQPFGQRTQTPL